MQLKHEYPVAVICEVLDYPRSQVYYQAQEPVDVKRDQSGHRHDCGEISDLWLSSDHSSVAAPRTSNQPQAGCPTDG
jgi:hypothetical protein